MQEQNFIGGKFTPARSGAVDKVFNPATGEVLGTSPLSEAADVADAVEAAKSAFPEWSAKTPRERSEILSKVKSVGKVLGYKEDPYKAVDPSKVVKLGAGGGDVVADGDW